MAEELDPNSGTADLALSALAELVGGRVEGNPDVPITGVVAIDRASPTELGLLTDARYLDLVPTSSAGALLVSEELAEAAGAHPPLLVVDEPRVAMVTLLNHFHPPFREEPGIHPTAVVGDGVEMGVGVHVGPYAIVGEGASLGDGCILRAHVVVGAGARVGAGSILYPHVVVYPGVELGPRVILHAGARIGVDGFGYLPRPDGALKIPHVGDCVIEADVEIGANSCVDRGSIRETRVGAGSKLDNLVHIAHNVTVGPGALMAAFVGIAGSTTIGARTMWGGHSGAVEHTTVGDDVRVTGMAALVGTVAEGQTMMGFPARPKDDYMKAFAGTFRLDELRRRVSELEKLVADLRENSSPGKRG